MFSVLGKYCLISPILHVPLSPSDQFKDISTAKTKTCTNTISYIFLLAQFLPSRNSTVEIFLLPILMIVSSISSLSVVAFDTVRMLISTHGGMPPVASESVLLDTISACIIRVLPLMICYSWILSGTMCVFIGTMYPFTLNWLQMLSNTFLTNVSAILTPYGIVAEKKSNPCLNPPFYWGHIYHQLCRYY